MIDNNIIEGGRSETQLEEYTEDIKSKNIVLPA